VTGLSSRAKRKYVEEEFARYGRVRDCVVDDGIGLVEFKYSDEAAKALAKLDRNSVDGRKVRVYFATRRDFKELKWSPPRSLSPSPKKKKSKKKKKRSSSSRSASPGSAKEAKRKAKEEQMADADEFDYNAVQVAERMLEVANLKKPAPDRLKMVLECVDAAFTWFDGEGAKLGDLAAWQSQLETTFNASCSDGHSLNIAAPKRVFLEPESKGTSFCIEFQQVSKLVEKDGAAPQDTQRVVMWAVSKSRVVGVWVAPDVDGVGAADMDQEQLSTSPTVLKFLELAKVHSGTKEFKMHYHVYKDTPCI